MEFRIAAMVLFGMTLGILHAEGDRLGALDRFWPDFGPRALVQISENAESVRSSFDPVALPAPPVLHPATAPRFVRAD
ncbi:hypothetical protein PUH89_08955 [Rhodobacter capsulatus]|uniref:Uncharacterized protein n=1 Tax=Rhodobacter capsulatus TaxID=1061 RepID=A0A1G7HWV9_RHOCA|nr:hypothetical protein [Rhodobacter capsulatus]WER11078.1 hypothetical protein PUH89_08955 [Rhodobacter capsulatus]SDF04664.1 hypothetical protein SAMN04244550_01581 [Rhodobacter capsulatus]